MKSVYIHIPFCKTICSYCDFCKRYYDEDLASRYLDALEKEISKNYKGEVVNTLYIGGGTPNSLSNALLERLFIILSKITLNKEYEYTIECNIELLTIEQIKLFNKYGINRVSLGVQTFNENHLEFLNRHHKKEDAINRIKLLKENNINNINVDLIYAIPGETLSEVESDLDILLDLDLPHISTYSLIIENHTLLKNKNVKYISEDLDSDMYNLICDKLNNYHHYETSNFAKEGYESKHNLTYWNNDTYYGFGLGASGYISNIRYSNTWDILEYIKGHYIKEKEELSFNETVENEFILGFRKVDGINIDSFINKYKFNPLDLSFVKDLIKENKLEVSNNNLRLTKEYLYKANSILIEFMGVDYEK